MMTFHSKTKKIFISGSRAVDKLNDDIRECLDSIMGGDHEVLIGDAKGVDEVVQQYLADAQYKHVTVYYMGEECRINNYGWHNDYGWQTVSVTPKTKTKNFKYFAQKDKKMSNDADDALMIWDGKGTGTLNNVLNMLEHGKSSRVYFTPEETIVEVESTADLKSLLAMLGENAEEARAYFDKKIHLDKRIGGIGKTLV